MTNDLMTFLIAKFIHSIGILLNLPVTLFAYGIQPLLHQ